MNSTGKKIAGLVAALVVFIFVIAGVLWFSKETMGDHYYRLLWSGYASILLLIIGVSLTVATGTIAWM